MRFGSVESSMPYADFLINTSFLTLETLSWVFIFTSILSVIPISALSAGTKLSS